jgi:two-component sensor histidine kinase/PAS domain-containing protein
MSTLSELMLAQGLSSEADVEWLHLLAADGQLIADLAFADIVLWVPTASGSFVAVAHSRPSSAATLFYRDFVGQEIKPEWRDQVRQAFDEVRIVDTSAPDWYEETPTRVRAVPVLRRLSPSGSATTTAPIAVLTRHSNLSEARTPGRQELTFNQCADDLFGMIAHGDFPDLGAPTLPRRGAPRASDGLIRLDVDGIVTFASPNALSAFNRMGFGSELEGESLAEVATDLLSGKLTVDESLPLVVTGRAPWRTDIEARGVTVTLRAIPLRHRGERVGAIVLIRDVTESRHQEQELITKDATIREIHHRVKNNLQTVAALLRLQARRTGNDEAKRVLRESVRRVNSIAVVHETLSTSVDERVDLDGLVDKVIPMIGDVATAETRVSVHREGEFGVLAGELATPLVLVLTELVHNALAHAFEPGTTGEVCVRVDRSAGRLEVVVADDGTGMPPGFDPEHSEGLGLQIVRTLLESELESSLLVRPRTDGGTEAVISLPLRGR